MVPRLTLGLGCAGMMLALSLVPGYGTPRDSQLNGESLRQEARQVTASLAAPDSVRQAELQRLLADWMDTDSFTRATFDRYIQRSLDDYSKALSRDEMEALVHHHRQRVQAAVEERLERDLLDWADTRNIGAVHVVSHRVQDDTGEMELLILTEDGQHGIRGHLARQEDRWGIVELELDGDKLSDLYRARFHRILDRRYSPPVLVAHLLDRPYVVLEDFTGTPVGDLPLNWGVWRDRDQKKPLTYRIATQGDRPYLAAADSGQAIILGKFAHWNPRDYPIMTWCWRTDALPDGGDESRTETNDSAAGLYVLFSQNWLGVPRQVKYVWSTTLPVGTIGRRNLLFRPWYIVMESGYDNLGRWTFEKADLEDHHARTIGGEPATRTTGLGILTDASNTGTYAEAGYGEIRVWTRQALEEGLITDHCSHLNDRARTACAPGK